MTVSERRRCLRLLSLLLGLVGGAAGAEPRCINGDCQNGYGTGEIESGRIHRGFWQEGVRQGPGRERSAGEDELWFGQYANGGLNGKAVFTSVKDGLITSYYVGSWRGGRRHGYGFSAFADGTRYLGDFSDGLMQGQGEYVGMRGERYTGGFANDRFEGFGTFTVPGVLLYTGSWKSGRREGEGEESFFDGVFRYKGIYREDRPSQAGTVWMNGVEIHRGALDPQHGYGFGNSKGADGFFYVGELRDGRPDGRGAQLLPGGEVRTGLWAEGQLRSESARSP